MRYTDRSRVVTDWDCRRARFHGYERDGGGLQPIAKPEPLVFGGAVADQIANIKRGLPTSLEEIPPCPLTLGGQGRALAEALLIGYQEIIWPRWLEQYEVVSVEQECSKALTPWLTYNSRPDTIMRRREDGTYWYGPEDKTTAWVDSLLGYATNVQLHATAVCAEATLGEEISGALVQGLYKGFVKEGRLYHPLVWAYTKEGLSGIVPDQWQSKYKYGWERRETKYFPGGVKAWILQLPKETLAECFPASPPVMIRRDLVEKYFAQVIARENEIEVFSREDMTQELDLLFPQNFNQCEEFGKGKKACIFKPLCWQGTAQKFPLQFYKARERHHPEAGKYPDAK